MGLSVQSLFVFLNSKYFLFSSGLAIISLPRIGIFRRLVVRRMVAYGEWSFGEWSPSGIGRSKIGRSEIGRSEIGHSENDRSENGRCTEKLFQLGFKQCGEQGLCTAILVWIFIHWKCSDIKRKCTFLWCFFRLRPATNIFLQCFLWLRSIFVMFTRKFVTFNVIRLSFTALWTLFLNPVFR
jgi:hypothetical protein